MSFAKVLQNACHGDRLVSVLGDCLKSGHLADVKAVTLDGDVFWCHKLLLASVSPLLKDLFLAEETKWESVVTLQLPHISSSHFSLVLDYLYTGAMYLTASNLAGVLRVMEVLRMKCGVSVSKMVQHHQKQPPMKTRRGRKRKKNNIRAEEVNSDYFSWVEEAQFCGLEQLQIKDEIEDEEDISHFHLAEKNEQLGEWSRGENDESSSSHQQQPEESSELSPEPEKPIEVQPDHERRVSQEFDSVEVIEESDNSEEEEEEDEEELSKPNNSRIKSLFDPEKEEEDKTAKRDSENDFHFKCVMCGKSFQHEANLKVHIRVHLGVNAALNTCQICKRHFRSSTEHELHSMSHKYTNVGNLKLHTKKKKDFFRQKLVSKAIKRLYFKNGHWEPLTLTKALKSLQNKKLQAVLTKEQDADPFKLKMKVKLQRVEEPQPPQELPKRVTQPTAKLKIPPPKKSKNNRKAPLKKRMKTPLKVPAPKKRQASTPSYAGTSKKQRKEDALTCPTCDKTFVAQSIFNRHVKTYKHGVYSQTSGLAQTAPPAFFPAMGKGAAPMPHMNPVVQPTVEVHGRQVNKYECHLCQRVFLRIKDLVKHRERNCSAWTSH